MPISLQADISLSLYKGIIDQVCITHNPAAARYSQQVVLFSSRVGLCRLDELKYVQNNQEGYVYRVHKVESKTQSKTRPRIQTSYSNRHSAFEQGEG